MFVLAQILSLIAMTLNVLAYQLKEKHTILITSAVANFTFMINYFLLKAYIGSFVCLGYIIVILIDIFLEKNKSDTPTPIIILYILFLIMNLPAINNLVDVLPIIATAISFLVVKLDKEQHLRIIRIISTLM